LLVAVAFNSAFSWRRYPAAIQRWRARRSTPAGDPYGNISHADLVYALSQIDSFIDVTEQDLLTIYDLAMKRHFSLDAGAVQVKLGSFYSNGRYGADWSIRQVVDTAGKDDPEQDQIIYKTVAGAGRRTSGTASRAEFLRWARYEVERNENSWQRITSAEELV